MASDRINPKKTVLPLLAPCLAIAIFAANASAQEITDPEIEQLEASYRDELIEIRKDLGTKWLEALTKRTDELTRGQKFAEALLYRSEQQRVRTMLASDPLPGEISIPVKKVPLIAADAKLEGAAESHPQRAIIVLSEKGSSATWNLPAGITAGRYELLCQFGCGSDGGGEFEVALGEDQKLSGKIKPTPADKGNWKKLRSTLIGECVVDELTGTVKLSFTKKAGSGALMNLNRLELAPLGTWAELQAVDDDDPKRVAEADRGRQFEKLEGVKWIDKDDRQSGEIAVRHGEKDYTFRLYFVQLPPTDMPTGRAGKSELERLTRQLRTTADKVIRFGKKVDTELRDELWTEKLTIYTRWETRGRAGSPYAFILVGDSPLSLSLMEKGHARSGGAFASQAPFVSDGKKSARTFGNQLRQAEKEAKQERRGLWGL